jgi:hypothetical protein
LVVSDDDFVAGPRGNQAVEWRSGAIVFNVYRLLDLGRLGSRAVAELAVLAARHEVDGVALFDVGDVGEARGVGLTEGQGLAVGHR